MLIGKFLGGRLTCKAQLYRLDGKAPLFGTVRWTVDVRRTSDPPAERAAHKSYGRLFEKSLAKTFLSLSTPRIKKQNPVALRSCQIFGKVIRHLPGMR